MADPNRETIPDGSNTTVGDSLNKKDVPNGVLESEGGETQQLLHETVQRNPQRKITDNKFCLLLWKNYILQKRHLCALITEVFIIPLLFLYFTFLGSPEWWLKQSPGLIPLFLTLTFMYPVANICKSIVYEKEKRLKESMKMMGLPEWLHWSAWLAKSFISLGISVTLITITYKRNIYTLSDISVIFVFLLSYAFSSITFGFLVASFCSKSTSSSTACSLLFFFTYIAYTVIYGNFYKEMSTRVKVLCSLFNNIAMGFGVLIINNLDQGIHWSNIANGHVINKWDERTDNFSLLAVIGMLILDGFLYLSLAIYLEAVFPGEFGVPLPFYFPLMPSYWCGRRGASGKVHPVNAPHETTEFFEKEPENLSAGIQILGLKKVFGRKVAVDGLTLNFYENQVTALLGHNGAGKTTTMSMLTGLFPPSSGTALVNGFDIRKEMKYVQHSLGLCPQHDVLFDEMTVEEHLKFFCKLKGYALPVEQEIDRMLVALNLVDKRYAQSKTLSGGMKRKLSVGIALIGGSKVVLLDEPTAGMDPGARRSTWDLISGEKEGRTILLSTHFMDEADLLGDRIAILAHGKAVCCGSSLFLKKKYGGGYHLIMVKEPKCQVSKITELLQKYIPEVAVDQNVGTELSYSLPDKKLAVFPDMFDDLEKRTSELGIGSYGCSITTMEEVFIRVGEQVEAGLVSKLAGPTVQSSLTENFQIKGPSLPKSNTEKSKTSSHVWSSDESSPPKVPTDQEQVIVEMNNETEVAMEVSPPLPVDLRNMGLCLHFQQLWAMLVKKGIYAMRSWFTYLVLGALPVVLFSLVLLMPKMTGRDARRMKLDRTIGSILTFIMSYLAAGFLILPIKEREVNSKHLQFVSGVPILTFWVGHFLFDMGYYLIISILLTTVSAVIPVPTFNSTQSIWAFFLVLIFYGWAVIPMTYVFSFQYTVSSTGYTRTSFFYFIMGNLAWLLATMAVDGKAIGSMMLFVLSFVPNFLLGQGIVQIDRASTISVSEIDFLTWGEIMKTINWEKGVRRKPEVEKHGIIVILFYLFLTGALCLARLFWIEFRAASASPSSRRPQNAMNVSDPTMLEDSDVTAENERIRNGDLMELCTSETMILQNLTKYYGSFLAVDNVCLGVQNGECFGLLGINGAGKTTVFKMLTGELRMSSGDAFVNGKSISRQIKEVQKVIGYCPQFDALIPEMTGRETIRFFARLRGIREREIDGLINTLAADLLLTEHVQQPCRTYSGGNKRKLSTAISLIGNPSMVFLDEPTAGLDPVARRYLWNAVIKMRESGSSVVLTSHSMEECEALCTRVAIMVNGKFRCLGSTQHLKNKFGDGYTLIAQMPAAANEEQSDQTRNERRTSLETGRRRESLNGAPLEPWEAHIQPLRLFIEENFTDCQLKDMHPCYVHYHIPMGSISWGQMFRKMEEAKALFQLEAYSIGQTSLEQVFLGFSKGQYNAND